jgi:glycosyltransferase involved in cell wall biosynthesis
MAHVQHYLKLLEQNGTIEDYFRCAQEIRISERVVFTGYLTHHELRYIFPNCDVAVFPTPVSEAGPLVFLEAMSAGVFPLGIYQESLAAGIDTTAHVLPSEAIDMMKLRVDEEHAVQDIASHALTALKFSHQYSTELHRVAKEFYDWQAVANKFLTTLDSM